MAKDPAMSGPVSKLEGGSYESSEEVRAKDAGENIPEETGEGLTRSEIINMFGEATGRALLDAGYASFTSLRMASDEELLAISGVGPAKVETIRARVGKEQSPEDEQAMPELADLDEGAPVELRQDGPAGSSGETYVDPGPKFGDEGAAVFGDEGAVSPRIARMRAAAGGQAVTDAAASAAITNAEIAAAGGVIEGMEAEIEVVEEEPDEDDALDEQFIEEQLDDETEEEDAHVDDDEEKPEPEPEEEEAPSE